MSEADLLRMALDTLKDARHELGEPEVAELTTLKLDVKVERTIEAIERYFLGEDPEVDLDA